MSPSPLDLCHDLAAQGSVIQMFVDPSLLAASSAGAALTPLSGRHDLLYLILAALCVLLALSLLKRVLAQVGAMIQAVASAGVVTFMLGAALALLAAAAFVGR